MNLSAPFILRPVATSLLMIAILLVGVVGYQVPAAVGLPEVDYPTIQVQSFYPGASPDVMTTSVTAILERQFGQMPGLKEMSSVSSAGSSVVTLQFDLNLSLDIAEQEVQAAINAGGSLLPQLPAPPVYAKVNPADAPVITLAVSPRPACRSPRSRIWPTPASPRRFPSWPASAWSAFPAASARPCGCRPICSSWRPMA